MIDIYGIIGNPPTVGIVQLVRPRHIRRRDSSGITHFYLDIHGSGIEIYSRFGDPLQWMRVWSGHTFLSFKEARNFYPNAIRLKQAKFDEIWSFYKFEDGDL